MGGLELESIGLKRRMNIVSGVLFVIGAYTIFYVVNFTLSFFDMVEPIKLNKYGIMFYLVLFALFFMAKRYVDNIQRLPCPYCGKSPCVRENWQCDNCYQTQGRQRLLSEDCVHCKRHIDSACCEYCGKEFKL